MKCTAVGCYFWWFLLSVMISIRSTTKHLQYAADRPLLAVSDSLWGVIYTQFHPSSTATNQQRGTDHSGLRAMLVGFNGQYTPPVLFKHHRLKVLTLHMSLCYACLCQYKRSKISTRGGVTNVCSATSVTDPTLRLLSIREVGDHGVLPQ